MKKLMVITAAAMLVASLASGSAFAQGATKKAAVHKTKHTTSCYNYAWDSQAQKDCLAKPASAPAPDKKAAKAKKKTA